MRFEKGTTLPAALPPLFVACAHEGCGVFARVRKNNANLCYGHYIEQGNSEARRYAERHNLQTVDDHRAHCRKLFDQFSNQDMRAWMKNPKSVYAQELADSIRAEKPKKVAIERVPGEDDESHAFGERLADMVEP